MILDEAVEAAAIAAYEDVRPRMGFPAGFDGAPGPMQDTYRSIARAALEAALPTLLSHEREETRLAHLDAVVNAATVDRLEGELARAKAEAWDEGKEAGMIDYHNTPNPYRAPEVGA